MARGQLHTDACRRLGVGDLRVEGAFALAAAVCSLPFDSAAMRPACAWQLRLMVGYDLSNKLVEATCGNYDLDKFEL